MPGPGSCRSLRLLREAIMSTTGLLKSWVCMEEFGEVAEQVDQLKGNGMARADNKNGGRKKNTTSEYFSRI